ncbi:hypothetical protein ACI2J4_17060 [Agrobacterium tumefaciens]|uniref:hypothetical protein n=1 Tax=Agrobacterium tumefaciens TaxID=358 RepID=UPI00384D5BF1
MRIILFGSIAFAAIAALGANFFSSSTTSANEFSVRYLQLARINPQTLTSLISTSLPNCLGEAARRELHDTAVADLATKTYFRSGVLMAEGKSADESANELIFWIIQESKSLNNFQKQAYIRLSKGGLMTKGAILCVHSQIRAAMDERINLKAFTWNFRA